MKRTAATVWMTVYDQTGSQSRADAAMQLHLQRMAIKHAMAVLLGKYCPRPFYLI